MVRKSITFPNDLNEALQKWADDEGRSFNKQVVYLLQNLVDRKRVRNVLVVSEPKKKRKQL